MLTDISAPAITVVLTLRELLFKTGSDSLPLAVMVCVTVPAVVAVTVDVQLAVAAGARLPTEQVGKLPVAVTPVAGEGP